MAEVSSNQNTKFRKIPFTFNNRIEDYYMFYNRGTHSSCYLKGNVAGYGLATFDIVVRQEYANNGTRCCKIALKCTSQIFPKIEITNCSAGIVNRDGTFSNVININDNAVLISKEDTGLKREISSDAKWFNSTNIDNWLVGGALNIRVTGYIAGHPVGNTPALMKELKNLLNDEETSDLKVLVGEKVFYCHKIIYMCRSPVFKTMLTADMKEKSENSVTITDTDPDTYEMFNQFLYTDTVSFDSPSTAPAMLYLAEKYNVESLKKFCEFEMLHTITTANCLDYCISGYTSNCKQLYENTLTFIKSKLTDITKTEEWKKMKDYPEILMKLVGNIAGNYQN